jgi:hypothetical protein
VKRLNESDFNNKNTNLVCCNFHTYFNKLFLPFHVILDDFRIFLQELVPVAKRAVKALSTMLNRRLVHRNTRTKFCCILLVPVLFRMLIACPKRTWNQKRLCKKWEKYDYIKFSYFCCWTENRYTYVQLRTTSSSLILHLPNTLYTMLCHSNFTGTCSLWNADKHYSFLERTFNWTRVSRWYDYHIILLLLYGQAVVNRGVWHSTSIVAKGIISNKTDDVH